MSAARKDPARPASPAAEVHRSGEHVIGIDAMIRRSFESAFESDLQTTSRISRFDLEEVLSSPEVRRSVPPEAAGEGEAAITVDSLPPPAIEVVRTKEEERDP